jgi:hypothetical protein
MRRSGYLCCLLATFLVSSQPDAAYVPAARHVRAPAPPTSPAPARIASSPLLIAGTTPPAAVGSFSVRQRE